jgi:hypothetical protein
MKRSKIFLGLTTCLLGVAAFAASKFNSVHPFYVPSGTCVQEATANVLNYTTQPVSGDRPIKIGSPLKQTYISSNCQDPLYQTANLG